MKIEMLKTDDLIPYENNPRVISEKAVNAIANSIKEFGFKNPIIIDRNNVIVCGHGRAKAAKKLGIKECPCIRADDLTPEQIEAFRLADNKTSELSAWDFSLLDEELSGLKNLDMRLFGFDDIQQAQNEWFENRERFDNENDSEESEEYQEFVEKFEQKKTTDDCYTPDLVYDVICDYVEKTFNVKRNNFVRPFYPGGDYQHEKYPAGGIVVDNPPFSILAEIVDFFIENRIKFFIFSPAMSTLGYLNRGGIQAICTNAPILYENGAIVLTNFLTNLQSDDIIARTEPELFKSIDNAVKEIQKELHKELPKYDYPLNLVTSAKLGYLSKYGQKFDIRRSSAYFIRKLDGQGESAIYGGGLLISEKAAAEKAAAEKAAAAVFRLSDREKSIIAGLD